MYNHVFQEYFAKREGIITNYDDNTIQNAHQRPSTFETAQSVGGHTGTSIDTSGASVTVDDVREAFAKDHFDKVRQFYGERYTDYLRSLRVEPGWSVTDTPEVRGKMSTDWKFRQIASTTTADLGEAAGYFSSNVKIPVRKTFCPEHGLIGAFVVVRADPFFGATSVPAAPILQKMDLNQYWAPQFDSEKEEIWGDSLLESGATVTYDIARRKFDDYRLGLNENYVPTVGGSNEVYGLQVGTLSAPDTMTPSSFNANFDLTYLVDDMHYQATSQVRLARRSQISKNGINVPIR